MILHPIIFPIGKTDIVEHSSYVLLEHEGLEGIDSLSIKQKALEYINFKYHDHTSGGVVSLSITMSHVYNINYIDKDGDGMCYNRYIRYKVVYPVNSFMRSLYGDVPLSGNMEDDNDCVDDVYERIGLEICL